MFRRKRKVEKLPLYRASECFGLVYVQCFLIQTHHVVHLTTCPGPYQADKLDDGVRQYSANILQKCGHRGIDYYLQHRLGSVQELAHRLQESGFSVSLEPWDPTCSTFTLSIPYSRLQVMAHKLGIYILMRFTTQVSTCSQILHDWLLPKKDASVMEAGATPHQNVKPSDIHILATTPGSTTMSSQSRPFHSVSQPENVYSPTTRPAIHLRPLNYAAGKHGVSQASVTVKPPVAIHVQENFILLCFRVKRFLVRRHDLAVSLISCDQELFRAFRGEYCSKYRWLYRQFSLRTVQKISFVKVCDLNYCRRCIRVNETVHPATTFRG